ncbi:MAG: hypothetical protein ABIT07_04380 [Ferruginibacter sp.]
MKRTRKIILHVINSLVDSGAETLLVNSIYAGVLQEHGNKSLEDFINPKVCVNEKRHINIFEIILQYQLVKFLLNHSDIHFGMGSSVLDGAKWVYQLYYLILVITHFLKIKNINGWYETKIIA